MPWFEPRPLSYAAIGDPTFIPMTTENHNYQFAGSVTKTLGAHSFKVGGGVVYRQFGVQQSQSPRSMFAFDVAPDEELGGCGRQHLGIVAARLSQPDSAHPLPDSPGEPHLRTEHVRTGRLASHVVADRQPRPSIRDLHAHDGSRGPDVGLQSEEAGRILVAGRDTTRTGGVNTDYSDIGPRVGFAATLPGRMVLRSGFGMTYNPVLRGAGSFLKNPPFTQNFGPTNSAAASARPARHPPEDAGSAADLEQRIDAGGPGAAARPGLQGHPRQAVQRGARERAVRERRVGRLHRAPWRSHQPEPEHQHARARHAGNVQQRRPVLLAVSAT